MMDGEFIVKIQRQLWSSKPDEPPIALIQSEDGSLATTVPLAVVSSIFAAAKGAEKVYYYATLTSDKHLALDRPAPPQPW